MGAGKLIDQSRLAHIFVSPRVRARSTFELLLPPPSFSAAEWKESVTFTKDIAEWDYGDYEGLKAGEIRNMRKERGLDREGEWDIWRDGCEGGEYVFIRSLDLLLPSCCFCSHINLQIYAASQRPSRPAHLANPKYPEASHERGGTR